jgi:hypothetical protein
LVIPRAPIHPVSKRIDAIVKVGFMGVKIDMIGCSTGINTYLPADQSC